MPLSNLSGAPNPQDYIVTSRDQRRSLGIGQNYVDTYNDMMSSQYNNDFNYFMWQKQNEYNTPSAQVQRLKDAGLNPNFNSIEGAGNAGAMPSSQMKPHGNIQQNRLASIQTGLDVFNNIINQIGEGIDAVSKISGIPNDISGYRKMLNSNMFNKVANGRNSAEERALNILLRALEYDAKAPVVYGPGFGSSRYAPEDYNYDVFLKSLSGRKIDSELRNLDLTGDLRKQMYQWNDLSNPLRYELMLQEYNHLKDYLPLLRANMNWRNQLSERAYHYLPINSLVGLGISAAGATAKFF